MRSQSDTDTAEIVLTPDRLDTELPRPFSSLVQVDFGALSHVGTVRTNNEDHYQVLRLSRSMRILGSNLPPGQVPPAYDEVGYSMAVADGMGGVAAGEVASMLAITFGTRITLHRPKWTLKMDEEETRELLFRAQRLVRQIQEAMSQEADANPALARMGTTLTVSYSLGDDLYVFHVGDSRAYLFRDGELRQLTHDHTVAQAMADAGQIPQEEVATHRKRHVLVNVLSVEAHDVFVEMTQVKLEDGDRVLLCSDGLTEMVKDAEITAVLAQIDDSKAAAQALVERALAHGGRDNVTVLLARYRIPNREETS